MQISIEIERKLKKNIRIKKDYLYNILFYVFFDFCVGVKTPGCLFVMSSQKNYSSTGKSLFLIN